MIRPSNSIESPAQRVCPPSSQLCNSRDTMKSSKPAIKYMVPPLNLPKGRHPVPITSKSSSDRAVYAMTDQTKGDWNKETKRSRTNRGSQWQAASFQREQHSYRQLPIPEARRECNIQCSLREVYTFRSHLDSFLRAAEEDFTDAFEGKLGDYRIKIELMYELPRKEHLFHSACHSMLAEGSEEFQWFEVQLAMQPSFKDTDSLNFTDILSEDDTLREQLAQKFEDKRPAEPVLEGYQVLYQELQQQFENQQKQMESLTHKFQDQQLNFQKEHNAHISSLKSELVQTLKVLQETQSCKHSRSLEPTLKPKQLANHKQQLNVQVSSNFDSLPEEVTPTFAKTESSGAPEQTVLLIPEATGGVPDDCKLASLEPVSKMTARSVHRQDKKQKRRDTDYGPGSDRKDPCAKCSIF